MTVVGLIRHLLWLLLTGRCRPGDPIVREWGDRNKDGTSNFKRVYFVSFRERPEAPLLSDHPDDRALEDGGGSHRMYRKGEIGPIRNLVELD